MLKSESLYDVENVSVVHHVNQALRAHKLFQRDKDYIVRNGEVVIIDEFTGRMMPGRRYSEGLHQALEAKEHQPIQPENQTLASITFQNYFRMYKKLAGMTGTALTEADEFLDIYNLEVLEVPTNMPMIRDDQDDEVYRTNAEKYRAIITLLDECKTRASRCWSAPRRSRSRSNWPRCCARRAGSSTTSPIRMRSRRSTPATRAPRRPRSSRSSTRATTSRKPTSCRQAGVPGAITIATNMAGRGTDIQLGGNADMRIRQELHDVEDYRSASAIRAPTKSARRWRGSRRRRSPPAACSCSAPSGTKAGASTTSCAAAPAVRAIPGRSKFFLSLEDDLMRIFGSDKLDGMLTKLGLKEDEAIVHPWINKALEKAQQKVEARNFDIRKNILKFDNVMNDQRKVIFDQRVELMKDEKVAEIVADMRHDVIDDLVAKHVPENAYPEQWDTAGLKTELERVLGLDLPVDQWAKEEGIADEELLSRIERRADEHMAGKVAQWGPDVMRYVEKSILLQTLDHLWREHLLMLEHLRQVIGLRGYGQRDPLNEYKAEAFNLFEAMIAKLREAVTAQLMRVEIVQQPPEDEQQNLPYMEAHKIDPATGEDEMALNAHAGAGDGRQRQRHGGDREPERPGDVGQGRPQRNVPVRLRQEVQTLPRPLRLSAETT